MIHAAHAPAWRIAVFSVLAVAAAGAGLGCHGDAAGGADSGSNGGRGGGSADGGKPPDVPFVRPDSGASGGMYVPQPGTCGLDAPAFCDTFEAGPQTGGRAGELDPARWSAMRGAPSAHADLTTAYRIGPALLPACRPGLTGTAALPENDTVICDPTATVRTRHLLTAAAAQNYGMSAYRVRQPFDFAGRTGRITLDVDLSNGALFGWPALALAEDPTPMPTFDFPERGSGPRNGFEIEFSSGWCNTANTVEPSVYTYRDYVETAMGASYDCGTPHAVTAPGALNHVEIYLTAGHLELWASDASPDGVSFPNFHQLWAGDLSLPFSRGYLNLVVRNHATMKYWSGSAWITRWDNVGFDGPVVTGWREHSAVDSLQSYRGLEGCLIEGKCLWRGAVIPTHPGTDCDSPEESCTFDEQGRVVGYVVPNRDEPPVSIAIPAVHLTGATRARLAIAVDYPWFEWNGVTYPPTHFNLRHRLNGGAWQDRFVTEVEANAFAGDFATGGAPGAGLLNQMIDLDLSELRDGTNTLELSGDGTWTGSYRIAVAGADLILTTTP